MSDSLSHQSDNYIDKSFEEYRKDIQETPLKSSSKKKVKFNMINNIF